MDNSKAFDIQFSKIVNSLKYSKNGKLIACLVLEEKSQGAILTSEKYSLILYDVENRQENSRINLKDKPIDYICFDSEGNNYAIVLFETSVFLWNTDTGEECGSIDITGSLVTGMKNLSLSNDGTYIGLTALDKTKTLSNATFARIYNIKEGIKVYEGKHGYIKNVAENICFSPDNSYVVVGIEGPTGSLILEIIKRIDDNKYLIEETLETAIGGAHNMQFHSNGRQLYVVEKAGARIVDNEKFTHLGDVVIYNFENRELEKFLTPNFPSNQGAYDFEFNNKGSLFLTKSDLGFKIFDNETGIIVLDISKEINNSNGDINILSASLHPFEDYVVVSLSDNTVRNICIYRENKDELFEIEGEENLHQGFTLFSNKGSKEYKKSGGCASGCLSMIFMAILLLFFIAVLGENHGFIAFIVSAVGIVIYKIWKSSKLF